MRSKPCRLLNAYPFFSWYNGQHRHSGIAYLTPDDVHFGRAAQIQKERQEVLNRAYAAKPERFVKGPPRPAAVPAAAWINPPSPQDELFAIERASIASPEAHGDCMTRCGNTASRIQAPSATPRVIAERVNTSKGVS